MVHFSFSENISFCGRLEEVELVPHGDLHFKRRLVREPRARV